MQGINEIVMAYVKRYSDVEKEFCPECLEHDEENVMFRPKGDKLTYEHGKRIVHEGVRKAAFCPVCGYSTLDGGSKPLTKEELDQHTAELATRSTLKNGALGYLNTTSIYAKDITNCTFKTFNHDDNDRLQVARYVAKGAKLLSLGNNTHMVLQGHTGTGKTHLAFAAVRDVLKRTNYQIQYQNNNQTAYRSIQIVFCSWPLLMEQIKDGFNDDKIKKDTDKTIAALKTADIAVIDDLGAERDTEFNFEQIDRLMQVREDLATIITTNQSYSELKEKYDDRTVSRIQAHSALIKFDHVQDYRTGAVS